MVEPIRISVEVTGDPEAAAAASSKAREAAVLELYRLGRISSGHAARLLGIERVDFLTLANTQQVSTIQASPGEIRAELAELDS